MARDIDSLQLQLSADLRRFEKSMAAMAATADRRLTAVERRAIQADRNLSRAMSSAGANMVAALRSSLTAVAPTLAAAFSAQQVIQYADSYTSLQNRLKAAGLEGAELRRVEDALYEAANRNGLQVQATAELYQRASLSRQRLGASEAQLLQLVSGTAAALRVQGTSAEAASGPLLQLGQALSGNKVQAEEYNSLIDGLPIVLQAAAKGSARFGGDVAKLTEQVKAGKVTSQEFFAALLAGFPAIKAQAGQAATTVGSALQTLDNELGRFIGQSDSSLSASERLAQGILGLANNLGTVTTVVGVLAALIGTRYLLALTASASATLVATAGSLRYQLALAGLAARQAGVTTATLLSTTAMRAFTAAIAANPIGALLVAVTAVAAGLVYLNGRFSEGARVQRELADAAAATDQALGEYEKAASDAAVATGAARDKAIAHANALRVEAVEAVRSARALRERTAALAADRAELAEKAAAEATRQGPREEGEAIGQLAFAGGAQREAQRARVQAEQARRDAASAEARLARIDNVVAGRGFTAPAGPSSSDGSRSGRARAASGPTPEELAAQREMLRLQGQVELLRAQGRAAEADAIQRQIDVINLAKQFADAGVQNARAAAQAQVDAVAQAEAAARGREAVAERTKAFIDEANAGLARQNDLMLDRLGYEAELARLSGDPIRIQQAERELFTAERVNELLRLRPGLTRGDAGAMAANEFDALDAAGRQGEMRDEFRSAFRDGIQAAIEGDMGGLFESLADRFTSRMLDNLADDLFDLLSEAAKGFGSGGGQGGAIAGFIGSLFGKRALGGPMMAGRPYIVGERRPEVVVPGVNSTVIPSVNAAMNRVQSGGRSNVVEFRQTINLEGANGDETIRRMAAQASQEAYAAAVARSRLDTAEQKRLGRYRRSG